MSKPKKTPAQKWQGLFRDVLRQANDVRDLGGMERVARMFSERDQEVLAGQLEELSEKLEGWASDLRGTYRDID
jgi:hypothetical protein